ncbi:MAG: lysylphosphatidylglycerol synthase domain-containing protein [Actinomycetota bacterium]
MADARSAPSPVLRAVGLGAGFLLLTGVAVYGFRAVELDGRSFVPGWLALLSALATMTLLIITAEFRLLARITGTSVSTRSAFSVSVIGAAANLLPLPGSTITRFVALQRHGASTSTITAALFGGALVWLGTAGLVAAAGLTGGSVLVGVAFAIGALVALGGGLATIRRAGATNRDMAALTVTELCLTVVGIARFLTAAAMLSLPGSLRETAALAAAGPASAAVGIVPGGLGIRESLAAALGAVSGLGGAEAAVIAVVDRAVGLGILVPAYLVIVTFGFRTDRDQP